MRLVTFEKIDALYPIQEKDRIELAKVLEYNVVVRKDSFKVGDWCVYVFNDTKVDTLRDHFSFLNKKGTTNLFRVKTAKIGDEYSEGMAFPLSAFSNITDFPDPNTLTQDEIATLDLASLLGVTKYVKKEEEDSEQVMKTVYSKDHTTVKSFPAFPIRYIPVTDEDNLKTKKKVLSELIGQTVDVSLKMDGSSMTLIWEGDTFIVSSRKISLFKCVGDEVEYEYPANMLNYCKDNKLRDLFRGRNIILQGEYCGPKVNGNKMHLDVFKWYIFTIYDINEKRYFNYSEISDFCYEHNLSHVPILQSLEITEETTVNDFQVIADSVKYNIENDEKCDAEGIVVRPRTPFKSRVLGRNCSFKVINRSYKD